MRLRVLTQIQHRLIRIFHKSVRKQPLGLLYKLLYQTAVPTSLGRRAPILKRQSKTSKQKPTSPCSIPSTREQKHVFFFTVDLVFALTPRLTCRGENAPDDSAQSHQELPQRHVLLGDRHRQRAGVVLHKDARHTVTAHGVVYHPLLGKHNRTPRCRRLDQS